MAAQLPQEVPESQESDDAFITAHAKPASLAPMTILLTRSIWGSREEAHLTHTKPSPCPSPHKGYQVQKEDWTFLGAVCSMDPLLVSVSQTKDSKTGVLVLQGHYGSHVISTQRHLGNGLWSMPPK